MGYLDDAGKVISGTAKNIPDKVDMLSAKAGLKVGLTSLAHGASEEGADLFADAAMRATKYGIYGAAGAGVAGTIYGVGSPNQTVASGSVSGAGLGAIGGGAAGIAIAIAKGIR